jgi:hypothetical protein
LKELRITAHAGADRIIQNHTENDFKTTVNILITKGQ